MEYKPPPRPSPRGVPGELRERKQWIPWRAVERDGKMTKEPINPSYTSRRASVTDPLSWSTFDHALAVYEMHPHLDGIGFVFTERDPYCGIDFDGWVSHEGEIAPWAADWIQRLGGYAEFSPSLMGIHAIVRATLPGKGRNNRTRKIELYDRERFFTVTGIALEKGATPTEAQAEVDALLKELYPPQQDERVKRLRAPVIGLTDEEVLQKACTAGNGWKFRKLYDGNWRGYPSQSEADQALMALLVFWTGGDPEQVLRIFERSALHRPRGKGRDYASRTLDAVLASYRGSFYNPDHRDPRVVATARQVLALLEGPVLKGRKAPVARALLTAFAHVALEHGTHDKDGVLVSLSLREAAEKSGTRLATVCNSALPYLVEAGFLKWRSKGAGKKRSTFLLRVPRKRNIRNSHAYNVTLSEREQLNRLRGGWDRFASISRVSKTCELPLLHLLGSERQTLTFSELVSLTGRSISSIGNSMRSLVGANLVVERERGVYNLPPDFWDRFNGVLRASGVTKSENRQKDRHEKDRLAQAGWIQRWEQGEEAWVNLESGEVLSRKAAISRVKSGEGE